MGDQQLSMPSAAGAAMRPELLEAVARAVAAVLVPSQPQPAPAPAGDAANFLTTAQFARRLGVSRETVRRLAIAGSCRAPWSAAAPGKRPAGSRAGSRTTSRPAAWTWPTWPGSPPGGGPGPRAAGDASPPPRANRLGHLWPPCRVTGHGKADGQAGTCGGCRSDPGRAFPGRLLAAAGSVCRLEPSGPPGWPLPPGPGLGHPESPAPGQPPQDQELVAAIEDANFPEPKENRA